MFNKYAISSSFSLVHSGRIVFELLEIDVKPEYSVSCCDSTQMDFDAGFVERIESNTKRYVKLFAQAADILMPLPTVDVSTKRSALDVVAEFRTRQSNLAAAAAGALAPAGADQPDAANQGQVNVPAELQRRLCVS